MLRIVLTLVAGVSLGCAGSGPPDRAASPEAAQAPPEAAALVDMKRIEACAGFTAEKAAAILGVESHVLETRSGYSELLRGQSCRFWSRESNIGPGLQFDFKVEDSPAAAIRFMARLRRSLPAANASIDKVAGKKASAPPLVPFENVGDEAFWEGMNHGVVVRLANVIVTIQASASRSLATTTKQAEIELERRVAEEVMRGLQSS